MKICGWAVNNSVKVDVYKRQPRNLNERVELMVPIEDKRHKERVKGILDLYLEDTLKAHIMRADGSYRKINAVSYTHLDVYKRQGIYWSHE